jgi:hypothetical protein
VPSITLAFRIKVSPVIIGTSAQSMIRKSYSPVIARSPCDEAIHLAACAAMDCFADRTALCAEPVARNDGLKIPQFIGRISFSAVGKGALCAVPTISDAKRWWARHRPARSRGPLAFAHPTIEPIVFMASIN